MTRDEFAQFISDHPALKTQLDQAYQAAPSTKSFGPITDAAVLALMYPVAVFVVRDIGLPWLYEAKRYSELWRIKFHKWIDERYQAEGFDPDVAEIAGEELRQQLAETNDPGVKAAWERFAALLSKTEE